jgi:hypothetical protein
VAAVAELTELAALRPGDVVVVDDVLAPPSLRTIIDELDFAYWWPTEGIFGNPNRNRSPNARTRTSRTRTVTSYAK